MSAHVENLGRAARMLKRLDDIGGPSELEGVPIKEIIGDVLLAQRVAIEADALNRLLAPPSNVIPIDTFSRRVGP